MENQGILDHIDGWVKPETFAALCHVVPAIIPSLAAIKG